MEVTSKSVLPKCLLSIFMDSLLSIVVPPIPLFAHYLTTFIQDMDAIATINFRSEYL
jgi:hypothetical protein